MRKQFFALLTLLILNISLIRANAPEILSFDSPMNGVSRAALEARTARIPVSWTTAHRPFYTTLVFEQILTDGTVINVELPRPIPWVNSNGNGVAAPILPMGSPQQIQLRVRLIDLFNGMVYDQAFLPIAITDAPSTGSPTAKPALLAFGLDQTRVRRLDLQEGTARIPVQWRSVNRPITATFFFEQILPDGRVVNVELPRATPWVNSSDRGMIAPIDPGQGHSTLRFRVRMYDLLFRRLYDVREISAEIMDEGFIAIRQFTTTVGFLEPILLRERNQYVPVSWNVSNRPEGTNLVFEQIFTDGSRANIELPRDFLIVPSSGEGTLQPFYPEGLSEVVISLRVADLQTNDTLAEQIIRIPIGTFTANEWVIQSGNLCYGGRYLPERGVRVGGVVRVERYNNAAPLELLNSYDPTNNRFLNSISTGTTLTITEGPYCRYSAPDAEITTRLWRVNANGQDGWVMEYLRGNGWQTLHLSPIDAPPLGVITIEQFTVSPTTAQPDEEITLTWRMTNAERAYISAAGTNYDNLSSEGSLKVRARELLFVGNQTEITLNAFDRQNNSASRVVTFTVMSTAQITQFSASPENPPSNGMVTLTWALEGTTNGKIIWNANPSQVSVDLTSITTDTGSYQVQLLDEYRPYVFTLMITDSTGITVTRDLTVSPSCPYLYFANDPTAQADTCPTSAPLTRNSAYQTFEGGSMLWLEGMIWVLTPDGRYTRYADWSGVNYTIEDTPPPGLYKPERGFGWVWSQNNLRDSIGWAIASEQGYTATWQQIEQRGSHRMLIGAIYVRLPDGRVIRFDSDMTWRAI